MRLGKVKTLYIKKNTFIIKILAFFQLLLGLPWWFSNKESVCQSRKLGFDSWVRKIPWKRKRQPTPAFLAGKSHGQRSLAGYIRPMGLQKSWTQLID